MPNINLLIEKQQQGPYTKDQVRQSLAEDIVPPDLPAWQEGLAEWVQVQSLVAPPQDPSPFPSPNEDDSLELQTTPSESPQTPSTPVLLEPRLAEVLLEMIRRRPYPVKKK
jgi:hypothetical protein